MTESMPENDVFVSKNVEEEEYTAVAAVDPPADRRRKKKSGAFGIFKAALYMMRKRRGDKKSSAKINLVEPDAVIAADIDQNPNWTKLVGSVRPFHLQEITESPPSSPEAKEMVPPASPAASSSRGTMSQYSSAASLLDLDNSSDEEEEDPDEVFDALTGDEMIDAKAEEFIAQFYKQMQLQTTNRYHNHHHQLSRGI